jgi:tape measure domain-containing protein
MNNVLKFYLEMKDMMSAGLAKVAKQAKTSFAQVENFISTSVHRGSKKAVDDLEKINGKLKQIDSTASSGSFFSGNFLKRIAPAAIAAAMAVGFGSFAKASAEQYIQFEKNNKSYEVLAGNKGIGRSLAGELNQLKQDTILGPAVYQNAKTMMSFGIGADKVIDNLKMLGQVSMGDADRLGALTLAFSQTNAAGKLMGQDLLQYVNAGFNPLHEISVMTGKSMGDLRKEMEKGAISSEMVTKAFEHATSKGGLFYGMLDEMSQTTAGKIANMHGKIAALQIALGERMAPAMNGMIDLATKWIVKLKHFIEIPVEVKLQDQINKIRALQVELTASNTSHTRQVELLHQLEQINPNIVKGISEQNIEYGKLARNIEEVTGALQKKIFLEQFNKANADTLMGFAEANTRKDSSLGNIYSLIGQISPALAQRTDLTLGQKQAEAQRLLQQKIAAGDITRTSRSMAGATPGTTVTVNSSKEEEFLLQLQKNIRTANEAGKAISKLAPEVAGINKTKDALTAQIDKFTGVKGMTASQIQNNGGKTNLNNSTTTDNVGKSIASGGPRVININGLKFADKIEFHAHGTDDVVDKGQEKLEELFLRVLNSGASVQ